MPFDIEQILEWVKCSPVLFSISQANLTFHDVSDLNINILWEDSKYTKYSSDSCGFYIISIKNIKLILS